MNATLSPVTVQRFAALQSDLIALVEKDFGAISPKLAAVRASIDLSKAARLL
jgi:hypothetical protein